MGPTASSRQPSIASRFGPVRPRLVADLPFWLVPGLSIVLPLLLMAWFNRRTFAYDAPRPRHPDGMAGLAAEHRPPVHARAGHGLPRPPAGHRTAFVPALAALAIRPLRDWSSRSRGGPSSASRGTVMSEQRVSAPSSSVTKSFRQNARTSISSALPRCMASGGCGCPGWNTWATSASAWPKPSGGPWPRATWSFLRRHRQYAGRPHRQAAARPWASVWKSIPKESPRPRSASATT